MKVPSFTLNTGNKIPALAFGIGTKWSNRGDKIDTDVVAALKTAYKHGFRHFDGAECYNTELELGQAIRDINRDELFITTKLTPKAGTDVQAHFDESLRKIGIESVDLYLLHAPFDNDIKAQWKEAEKIYRSGRAKAIGVSNFRPKDLAEILSIAEVKPAVNQIEYHAYLQNQSPDIVEISKKHGILVTAYGPLTPIVRAQGKGPLDPVLESLAAKYSKDPGQILLRWVYENGILPITTSSKPERVQQALEIFDFELSKEDVAKITETGGKFEYRAFWTDKEWNN